MVVLGYFFSHSYDYYSKSGTLTQAPGHSRALAFSSSPHLDQDTSGQQLTIYAFLVPPVTLGCAHKAIFIHTYNFSSRLKKWIPYRHLTLLVASGDLIYLFSLYLLSLTSTTAHFHLTR